MKRIILPTMNPEKVADQIGEFILNEIVPIKYTGAVIGLSGGVDSTVVAGLAKRAFEKYNRDNDADLVLRGYILPSKVNHSDDARDGILVAEKLGIPYEVLEIEPLAEAFRTTNPETFEKSYHVGNLYSELRATVLHRKAGAETKLVLGTGNRGEDFGVGYYTLFGDGAVHLSPIGGLSKRLVREMAVYLGFEELADRVPSAGLEDGQTDFKDLGYSYDFVELLDEGRKQGFDSEELVEHLQIIEMFDVEKGKYEGSYEKAKFENVEDAIGDIHFRGKISRIKARIVCPPVCEVNLDYDWDPQVKLENLN